MARFRKGQSGNPAGRPKGVRDCRVRYRDMIEPHVPALIERVISLALGGDTRACRLLMDRVIPTLRPQEAPLLPTNCAVAESARPDSLIASMARGELAPDNALTAMSVLLQRARLREIEDLESRLNRLELALEPRDESPQ